MTATQSSVSPEESFFEQCQLSKIRIGEHQIYHNLDHWNITPKDWKIRGTKISIDVYVPYHEMELKTDEVKNNPNFFNKNTCLVSINQNCTHSTSLLSYITQKYVTLTFNSDIEYVIFSTPYFYPHNFYWGVNKDYLYNKIIYSINFFISFIETYKAVFKKDPQMLFIKSARETRYTYEITILMKEYLTISYIKSNVETSTICCNLLIEEHTRDQQGFHQFTLVIPRDIRTNHIRFQITTSKGI